MCQENVLSKTCHSLCPSIRNQNTQQTAKQRTRVRCNDNQTQKHNTWQRIFGFFKWQYKLMNSVKVNAYIKIVGKIPKQQMSLWCKLKLIWQTQILNS